MADREEQSEVPRREPYQRGYGPPRLTGHLSQTKPDRQRTASSSTLPELDFSNHPFHLDFPTLNTDGSVDSLTAHESRRHTRTPPAALSSLGARVKMDPKIKDNMSESESSFADSQYDMIDDLSEISNDDHDTASIASNTDDAQNTPADTESEADSEESGLVDSEITPPRPSTAQSAIHIGEPRPPFACADGRWQHRDLGDLISSYASEDLETPRQSTMPEASSTAERRSTIVPADASVKPSSSTPKPDEAANHILLVSERDIEPREMDMISIRIASALDPATINPPHRIVRFPATPSGINLPAATAVYARDRLSATVQHCIDAASRPGSATSWQVRVLDSDGEHSTMYTVGRDAKIDLHKPDIAVIHLDDQASKKRWFYSAYRAVRTLNVPVLVVHQPAVEHTLIKKEDPSKAVLTMADFAAMERSDLTALVSELQGRKASAKSEKGKDKPAFKSLLARVFDYWTIIQLLIVLLLGTNLYLDGLWRPGYNPALEVSHRREGLIVALDKATNSTNAAQTFNVDHLLPTLDPACYSSSFTLFPRHVALGACRQELATSQGGLPNHLVVSLSADPDFIHRFPKVTSARMHKKDGRQLAFNQTKLIEGVYDFTFEPDHAYGTVFVNIMTAKPERNITASHDFGRRILQRRTYEKASTDVSKAAGKEVAIMRTAAKSLTERLSTEVGAGVWATKNVTTQLALQISKDLQAIGNTAVTAFSKAAQMGNQTANIVSKDFVLLQKDLVKFTQDLATTVKSKVEAAKSSSRKLIKSPLKQSRERLMGIEKALKQRKERKQAKRAAKAELKALRKSHSHGGSVDYAELYAKAFRAHNDLKQRVERLSSRVKKLAGQSNSAGLKQLKKQLRDQKNTLKTYEEKMKHEYEEAKRKNMAK